MVSVSDGGGAFVSIAGDRGGNAGPPLRRVDVQARRLRLLGVRVGSLARQSDLARVGDSEPNLALPLFQ